MPEQHPQDHHEHLAGSPPRVYVADLAAYNNGDLHGVWCTASEPLSTIWNRVNTMLSTSPIPGAEEIAIHDYEGFGPLRIDEHEPLSTIAKIGAGYAEHGEAFLHWAAHVGTSDDDELDRFDDAYLGRWDSMDAYAEELLDDLGIEADLDQKLPDFIRPYVRIDVSGFARDLAVDHVEASAADGGVHLFHA